MKIELESQSFLTETSDASQNARRFFCPEIANLVITYDREELTCRKKKLATKVNVWLKLGWKRFRDCKKKLTSLSTLLLLLWAQIFKCQVIG